MTQFSNTPLLAGSRPNAGFLSGQQLQNAIQTDSLQVFNVPAVGAINQGNNLAAIREAFGLVGQTVQAAGQITAQERVKQEAFDEGDAARLASLDTVDVAQGIDEGNVFVPDGVKASDHATQLVEARIATEYANKSDAWKRQYRASIPRVASMLEQDSAKRNAVKTAEAMNGFSELAYQGKIDQALAGARALPGITEQQVYAGVILPGLKTAAATGNQEAFDRLAAKLPEGMFNTDVDPLRQRLEASILARQSDEYAKAEDVIQGMLDDNTPLATVRATIDGLNEAKQLAPGKADHWRTIIDNRAEALRNEAALQRGAAIVNAAKTGTPYLSALESLATSDPAVYDRILPHVQRAEREYVTKGYIEGVQSLVQAGVPLATITDETIDLPSGGTVKINGKETQDKVMSLELNRIFSTGDPATRLVRMIDWSRDNDVYPPEFKTNLEIGVSQAGSLATGGQPTPMTLDAINTWREIQKRDPNWGRRLVDANTHRFLDAAVRNLAITQDNPATAIRLAVDAASVPADVQAYRRKQVWDKMVERENRNTLGLDMTSRNSRQVLERMRAIAESKADFGMNPDQALSEAAQEIAATTKKINGAYINMNVRGMTDNLRDNFEPLSLNIIKEYVGQSGQNTDDFTFEPDPIREGLWMVRKHGIPAEDPNGQFTFTTDALIARLEVEQKAAREAGKDKIIAGIKSAEQKRVDFSGADYRSRAAERFNAYWQNKNK